MSKNITLKLATLEDLPILEGVEEGVFDYPIKPARAKEFLNDARHHLVLALDQNKIVGMASAFHYVHPDKEPALFINEVGVLAAYQNQGIGRSLVRRLHEHAGQLGCQEVWLATERSNSAARQAFTAAGGVEDEEAVVLITFPPPGAPTR